MSLILNKIQDPRDALQKARRKDLERFAEQEGVSEVKPGMPAELMRKILRKRGYTKIELPKKRELGAPQNQAAAPDEEVREVDAVDALAAQWEAGQQSHLQAMNMAQLRKEAHLRGVKVKPRDKKHEIIARLEA